LIDNCIHVSNTDQKDDDNNGTWNLCEDTDRDNIVFINDNCPYDYNVDQQDTDGDGVGNVCDTDDNRFIESNRWFFMAIMMILVLVFGIAIFKMIQKLK
jgi:hypothetical protein